MTRLTDKDRRAIGVRSLEGYLDGDLKVEVKAYRKCAEEEAEPFRKWRNKVIAHVDKKRAIHEWPSTMEGVNLDACTRVLNQVHAILNVISLRRGKGSHLANEVVYNPTSGSLAAYLDDLVDGVRFIASIIDPEHPDGTPKRCRDFLDKLGRRGYDDY